jgi:hypothetical protein
MTSLSKTFLKACKKPPLLCACSTVRASVTHPSSKAPSHALTTTESPQRLSFCGAGAKSSRFEVVRSGWAHLGSCLRVLFRHSAQKQCPQSVSTALRSSPKQIGHSRNAVIVSPFVRNKGPSDCLPAGTLFDCQKPLSAHYRRCSTKI